MTIRVYTDNNLTPEPWTVDALCQQTNPDLFFADHGDKPTVTAAKQVCATCPVQAACLEYAIRTHQRHGIWAGKGPKQLAALRRTR